jgi:hypothetical protein
VQQNQTVKLPHDASINIDTNQVTFCLGNVNLTFTLDEWTTFCEMIDDINVALQTNMIEESSECSSCGYTEIALAYEEPSEDEFH